jgi:hypothetical protein
MIDRAYYYNGAGRGNAQTEAAVKEREATVPECDSSLSVPKWPIRMYRTIELANFSELA